MKNKIPDWWGSKVDRKLDKVISYCSNKRSAVDLGCGMGVNSKYLAKQGFSVTCVDFDQNLVDKFENDLKDENFSQRIKILTENIENFFSSDKYDLILALSVLHFFRMENVSIIISRLKDSLEKDGIIFIRVFSNKDNDFIRLKEAGLLIAYNEIHSPKLNKDFHYFEERELRDLLAGLDIIELQEYETQNVHSPEGEHKHWIFDILARK